MASKAKSISRPLLNEEDSIAAGHVPNAVTMNALGEREGMEVVTNGEDIWRGNELTPAPTSHTSIPIPSDAGEQMTFVSEDAGDASGGVGVNTLQFKYISATTGEEKLEDITMNGTTPVNSVATDICFINDMFTLTAGSNGVATGHIKVYKTGSVGLVYNMIAQGGNKSLVPNRMVPAGKTLILKRWSACEAQDKRVALRIRSTDMNNELIPGVFCFKDTQYLRKGASGSIRLNIAIPGLSIIKVSGWGDQANAECSCSWSGVLVDN